MYKNKFNLRNVIAIAICLAVTTMFSGCDKENDPPAISVADNKTLTQEVFADNEQGKSGVSFTTTGVWTSSISEVSPSVQSAQMIASTNSLDWVSISPKSGGAGTHTIFITLETNTTGADRTAIITVFCNGDEISITVTQKGKTEGGEVPNENGGSLVIDAKVLNGNNYNSLVDEVRAHYRIYSGDYDLHTLLTVPYQNGGFKMILPETLEANKLQSIENVWNKGSGYSISNKTAKVCVLQEEFEAYKDNQAIGVFANISESEDRFVGYVYVDKDCNLTGETTSGDLVKFDMVLKKGWNTVYYHRYYNNQRGETESWTTIKPNVNLEWKFFEYKYIPPMEEI